MESTAAADTLRQKLADLVGELDSNQLNSYKLLMSMAAGDLAATNKAAARSPQEEQALLAALHTIGTIRPPRVLWKGRPPFLDDTLLAGLQNEARARRAAASRTDFAWMHTAGAAAHHFAHLPALLSLLGEERTSFRPSGYCMYIYYLQPGDRIDPHVDEDITPINALLMVDHSYRKDPSHLLLYVGGAWQNVFLSPGEMIVFDGAATIHARRPIGAEETIALLTVRLERVQP